MSPLTVNVQYDLAMVPAHNEAKDGDGASIDVLIPPCAHAGFFSIYERLLLGCAGAFYVIICFKGWDGRT